MRGAACSIHGDLDIHKLEEAREKLTLARREWAKLGIPSSQIYAGSARAQLLESANVDDRSLLMSQIPLNEYDLKECITKTGHLQVLLDLKGFPNFQRSVIDFVDTERYNKADRDVFASLNDIRVREGVTSYDLRHYWQAAAMEALRAKNQKLMSLIVS